MLDLKQQMLDRVDYYSQEEFVNNPSHPNGFAGTWQLQDHAQIPQVLRGYLQRRLGVMRLRRKPIEEINSALNEVWQGPGSVARILELEYELQINSAPVKILPSDLGRAVTIEDEIEPQHR